RIQDGPGRDEPDELAGEGLSAPGHPATGRHLRGPGLLCLRGRQGAWRADPAVQWCGPRWPARVVWVPRCRSTLADGCRAVCGATLRGRRCDGSTDLG